ncbi:MAG: hypothetical protein JWQ36_626 [Enterovirga sp.]|jgi:hypothetical protein|nr:hypothetical protein [Enterovirga sp.]
MTDQHEAQTVDASVPRSQALVVVQGSSSPERPGDRTDAEFLAQLIACKRRLPAYRQARRANPDAATHAYAPPPGLRPALLNRLV